MKMQKIVAMSIMTAILLAGCSPSQTTAADATAPTNSPVIVMPTPEIKYSKAVKAEDVDLENMSADERAKLFLELLSYVDTDTPAGSNIASDDTSNAAKTTIKGYEADIGKFHVKVGGAMKFTDTDNEPCVVVGYEWTNNSDTSTSFMTAILDQCYQDGIQCEAAYIRDTASDDYMKEIKPGTTYQVFKAYKASPAKPIDLGNR